MTSPFSHYFKYALNDVDKLKISSAIREMLAKFVLCCVGAMFYLLRLDDALYMNQYFLSTNLLPAVFSAEGVGGCGDGGGGEGEGGEGGEGEGGEEANGEAEVTPNEADRRLAETVDAFRAATEQLTRAHPSSAIVFRSLDEACPGGSEFLRRLRGMGYDVVFARQVHYQDVCNTGRMIGRGLKGANTANAGSMWKKSSVRSDVALLKKMCGVSKADGGKKKKKKKRKNKKNKKGKGQDGDADADADADDDATAAAASTVKSEGREGDSIPRGGDTHVVIELSPRALERAEREMSSATATPAPIFSRIVKLYDMLYVEKHSPLNPRFTPRYVREAGGLLLLLELEFVSQSDDRSHLPSHIPKVRRGLLRIRLLVRRPGVSVRCVGGKKYLFARETGVEVAARAAAAAATAATFSSSDECKGAEKKEEKKNHDTQTEAEVLREIMADGSAPLGSAQSKTWALDGVIGFWQQVRVGCGIWRRSPPHPLPTPR